MSKSSSTGGVNLVKEELNDLESLYTQLQSSKPYTTPNRESFLHKAIQQQGRGQVMETIMEIQERHDAVKEMEKNLMELHQVFLDMAVLVQSQGEQLDDIESQVIRANSFVRGGTQQLQTARKHQKNTRKWTCFGIILLLIIIFIILLSIHPWKKK